MAILLYVVTLALHTGAVWDLPRALVSVPDSPFDPRLQILLHEFFGRGELAQGDFGRVFTLTHRADHLLLLLLVHLSIYVDPRYFSLEFVDQKDGQPQEDH